MDKKELVKKLVEADLSEVSRIELIDMLIDNPITVDIDKQERESLKFGDKVADRLSDIAGSWNFLIFFVLFLFLWVILNIFVLKEIDPYPFILLNLVLSCIAAIQAPIIMMSQHRAAKKDSLRNHNDYITDLKSELILEDLHRKLELVLKNEMKLIEIIEKETKLN